MITLALLQPSKLEPLKSWTFEHQNIIRIGRATDNDIVLYSAVVSRHHLQITQNGEVWELENLGANGTFYNGKAVKKIEVTNGMILSLAGSGPKLRIYLGPDDSLQAMVTDTDLEETDAEVNVKQTMT
jgi:serine/threonine-protein kinase